VAFNAAMYSASVVERATVGCHLDAVVVTNLLDQQGKGVKAFTL
jgi:hypothetical protein